MTARLSAFALAATLAATSVPVLFGQDEASPELFNVALTTLGATAEGSGQKFNKDWPAINALKPGSRGGALFGAPLTGGRVDIRLIIPVDVEAIAVSQLDYRGTRCPKAIDVYVEGEKVKSLELPHQPGKLYEFPLVAKQVQHIGIVVTEEHPREQLKNGKLGVPWGGWGRIQVLSTTDVPSMMAAPPEYQVESRPNAIAITKAALAGEPKVYGQPRQTDGHPCTIWDQQDIDHYKEMLKTSSVLEEQFAALKRAMDKRIARPLGIPEPVKREDGEWKHISDRINGKAHNSLSLDIANLGAAYALSGDERYAEFAKRLLLAYADVFDKYAPGNRPGFQHDAGKCFDQRLSDATWLIQLARGYDLIYNSPSIRATEREHIEKDLLIASADFIQANSSVMRAPTNWSAICTASVLITAYACDEPRLLDVAMYGPGGSADNIKGGVMLHFSDRCIDADGMWAEGAMGYQFMALQALITDAEVLWHHGIDMYRYRNAALKRIFDSPLAFSYPDLRAPAIHDSGHVSIVGRESYLYEFGYRRYRDPKYLAILDRTSLRLGAQFQQWPVSVLYDRDPNEEVEAVEWDSVNLFGVGYGILRNTSMEGTTSLLMDYGPDRSHGHPDKLNIDLWTFGQRLIPDPGSVWYEQPLYRNWYHTTLAHNTLSVDAMDQMNCGATQLVYAPGQTLGLQRATTADAYSGVTMDRSLFMTSQYIADLFGVFAQLPRQLDLCWHICGKLETDLATEQTQFAAPPKAGYSELANLRSTKTGEPWQATFTVESGEKARFIAAPASGTQTFLGDGWLGLERPTAIIQRRQSNQELFGNAIDLSNGKNAYVKSVDVDGSLQKGYGLLRVETQDGIDLCFAAYRPGMITVDDLQTDAQQAFVARKGDAVTALAIGSGTTLKLGKVSLTRSESGLLSLELTENGAYLLTNASPTPTTATIVVPTIARLLAYGLDGDGHRMDEPAKVLRHNAGAVVVELAGGQRVEFAAKGQPSLHEYRQKILNDRQAALQAAEEAKRAALQDRTDARIKAAAVQPVPANTLIPIQAESLTGQGEGEVAFSSKKVATVGEAFAGWNNMGHWLEWTVEVPADGYYNLAICYCAESALPKRLILINAEEQEPAAPLEPVGTGGWANNSDDWQIHTAMNPVSAKPLLLHFNKGANVLRLVNASGDGLNLDYLAIFSPDISPDRAALQKAVETLPPSPQRDETN